MSTKTPLVSVVIPTRNRHEMLSQAVASVSAQTYGNIELIVVDDGSDHPLTSVVEEAWHPRDPKRLKVLRQEPSNANVARNAGIRESEGEFVQFLDSDDLIAPTKFSIQVTKLCDNPSLDMTYCYEEFFDKKPGDLRLLWNVDWRNAAYELLDRWCWEEPVWQTAGPLWRRRFFFEKDVFWNPELSMWQDWEFHTRAIARGLNAERTPFRLVFLHDHSQPRSYDAHTVAKRLDNQLAAFESVVRTVIGCDKLTHRRASYFEGVLWMRIDQIEGAEQIDKVAYRRKVMKAMKHTAMTQKRKNAMRVVEASAANGFLFKKMCRMFRALGSRWPVPTSTWKNVYVPSCSCDGAEQ